jgi:SAM-dependent methyltransferase
MAIYKWVAQFYDQLNGDEAPKMTRYAREKVLGGILPKARVVCDLGCGTGATAVELARRGLSVYAVDNSPTMCRLAREKARRAGVRVRVTCADLRRFRLPEPADVVLCEFNPLNHLPRKTDLARAARAVARALRPGGWFYFDLNSRRTLEELYPSAHWFETRDFRMVLRGAYDKKRQKGRLTFEWFLPEGRLWRHHREEIEDSCWTKAEIRRALRSAGFNRLRHWDAVEVRPPSPHQKRGFDWYFLAQKKSK